MTRVHIARPSVASLFLRGRCNGHEIICATGFVALSASGAHHLITNRHVVTGIDPLTGTILSGTAAVPDDLIIRHNIQGPFGHWFDKVEPLYRNNQPLWKEHPTLGERADFVALPLTDTASVAFYLYTPSSPGPAISLGPADAVSVIGFPFCLAAGGSCGIWATGFLASEPAADFQDLPVQLVDCRTRKGQSGSPVIAYRNGGSFRTEDGDVVVSSDPVERFIGIYSGRINDKSDIGKVWKASAIAELLASL